MFCSFEEIEDAFLRGRTLLDVRAEVEFAEGRLPEARNLPLLNNKERELVGTTYKQAGQQAAIELGYSLISGSTREQRLERWRDLAQNTLAQEKELPLLYCFRGGLRSKISQEWIREMGFPILRIEGGYKKIRQYFIELIQSHSGQLPLQVVTGRTGSGKTRFLHALRQAQLWVHDLEALAHHRGSAFGGFIEPQPTQVDFENRLAVEVLRHQRRATPSTRVWVEAESRMIGKIVIPEAYFLRLRASPLIVIEESVESRVQLILEEYVISALQKWQKHHAGNLELAFQGWSTALRNPIMSISKRLGGVRTQEILRKMDASIELTIKSEAAHFEEHRHWIRYLLDEYYDPYYDRSIEKQKPRVIDRGSREDLLNRYK